MAKRRQAKAGATAGLQKKPDDAASSGFCLPAGAFCGWDGETLVLNILGTPSANRDAIGKPQGHQLKVSVTAAPVAGRSTDHMVRFLAKEFGVTPKDIAVVFGRFNVNKQLRIKSPQSLPAVIGKVLALRADN